ncbi:MAG: hypothetical protein JXX14_07160 [Deltaproteobacteria bacterium]|nr:hypothetical protein [Deltaproteobacteria bacterium]
MPDAGTDNLMHSFDPGAFDCMVVMTFYVSPFLDHKRAREIVDDAVVASKYLYLGKPMTAMVHNRITEQGQLLVEIIAKAYAYDARCESSFESDVTDRVLDAFRTEQLLPASAA